jgi:hypothetical protein
MTGRSAADPAAPEPEDERAVSFEVGTGLEYDSNVAVLGAPRCAPSLDRVRPGAADFMLMPRRSGARRQT